MKKIIAPAFFAAILILAGSTTLPSQAQAACNYQGYTDSNGVCVRSYNTSTYQLSNNTTYQRNQLASLEAQIFQLLAMLEQLRDLQSQTNFSNTRESGNSAVSVVTRSVTSVDEEDATLRGELDFNNEDEATVYFQYGESSSNLRYNTTNFVLDEDDDDESFEHTITNLDDDTTYYYRAVAEDEDGRRTFGAIASFTTDNDNRSNRNRNDDEPDLDVDSASDIEDTSAELSGSVDMNDFKNGVVFFVYGEDEDKVDDIENDYDEYVDVDEDRDDLQKARVDRDLDGDDDYTYRITGLSEDQRVYFSICVEYKDDDNDEVIRCSSVEDFQTDDDGGSNNRYDDEPQVRTEGYSSVTDDSARMEGSVEMNDFDNGIVFIIYGEDEDQVDDIADDYDTYLDIDEDGDDLQKIRVRSNIDGDLNFYANVRGLDDDTDIYFTACVEFKDDDNDDVIFCGATKSFETDN